MNHRYVPRRAAETVATDRPSQRLKRSGPSPHLAHALPQRPRRLSVAALLAGLAVVGSIGLTGTSAETAAAATSVCTTMQNPVRVSVRPATGAMLVTTSSTEATKARTSLGYTEGHGAPFAASTTAKRGLVPVYRLYNPRNHTFLWTIWPSEVASAKARHGWTDQGAYFYAASRRTSSCQVQIDRLYKNGVFRLAVAGSPDEQAWLKQGWQKSVAGTFFASPTAASKALTVKPTTPKTTTPKKTTPKKTTPKKTTPKKTTSPKAEPTTAKPAPAPSKAAPPKTAPSKTAPSTPKATTPATTAPSTPKATTNPPAVTTTGKPAAITGAMYLDKGSLAWHAYQSATDPTLKRAIYNIAATPAAAWLTGSSSDVTRARTIISAAAKANKVPQFVLYAMPGRDCGGYSAGGLSSDAAYRSWVDQVVAAIGSSRAIVILEPDAISFCGNNATVRARRTALLTYAAKTLHDKAPNTAAYLHAGSGQLDYGYAVSALKQSGIAYLRGAAMNVASHGSTAREQSYGDELMKRLAAAGIANKHYVVDTSRNGVNSPSNPGAAYNSCNNPNAALGTRPTSKTTSRYADAYLWIKLPGDSDGRCHPGQSMGWSNALALALVANARTHQTITYLALP